MQVLQRVAGAIPHLRRLQTPPKQDPQLQAHEEPVRGEDRPKKLVPEAVDGSLDGQLRKDVVVRLPGPSQSHEDVHIQEVRQQDHLHVHIVDVVLANVRGALRDEAGMPALLDLVVRVVLPLRPHEIPPLHHVRLVRTPRRARVQRRARGQRMFRGILDHRGHRERIQDLSTSVGHHVEQGCNSVHRAVHLRLLDEHVQQSAVIARPFQQVVREVLRHLHVALGQQPDVRESAGVVEVNRLEGGSHEIHQILGILRLCCNLQWDFLLQEGIAGVWLLRGE
mmetsp:Transcript_48536/g.115575  ORF Transcript_48536/g.115575 Transcript_48536/m.115575 type:complete len:280 (-) Transcript_48536:140-979(-)